MTTTDGPRDLRSAVTLRYDRLACVEASLSCGAALELAAPAAGEAVLDLGCGRGRDVLRAAAMVGPSGEAIGLDGSEAMLEAARRVLPAGLEHVRFVLGDLAKIELPDACVDVVFSNCAINHAPDKRRVYAEIRRVLRPGGRCVVSDVVAERELPRSVREDPAAWAACYGGAIPEPEYLAAMSAAGLSDLQVLARSATYERGGVQVRSLTVRARRGSDDR